MTDNEIIKALECCSVGTFACDEQCPCFHSKSNLKVTSCRFELLGDVLDLINRQKAEIESLAKKYEMAVAEREANVKGFTAEIERLKAERDKGHDWCNHYAIMCAKIKAEAIKEFAERLKGQIYIEEDKGLYFEKIDSLVKEMVGENNA